MGGHQGERAGDQNMHVLPARISESGNTWELRKRTKQDLVGPSDRLGSGRSATTPRKHRRPLGGVDF